MVTRHPIPKLVCALLLTLLTHVANSAAVDWATARVYDKLDGSLMTLYHYRGECQRVGRIPQLLLRIPPGV